MGIFGKIKGNAAKNQAKQFWDMSIASLKKLDQNLRLGKKSQYDIIMIHSLQNVIQKMIDNPPVTEDIKKDTKRYEMIIKEYHDVKDMLDKLEIAYSQEQLEEVTNLTNKIIVEFEKSGEYD